MVAKWQIDTKYCDIHIESECAYLISLTQSQGHSPTSYVGCIKAMNIVWYQTVSY